jgi:peptide/nickel transport system permease protein
MSDPNGPRPPVGVQPPLRPAGGPEGPGGPEGDLLHAPEEARLEVASQWQLVWWKFRKHKLALFGGVVVIALYVVAVFAEFLAPFEPTFYNRRYVFAPPQPLGLFVDEEDGRRFQLHAKGFSIETDPVSFRRTYVVDPGQVIPLAFFVKTEPYKLAGFIPVNRKLFGPVNQRDPMFVWGSDRLGRDVFSRVVHGTRISMSIGLVGVAVSLVLGILLGGISGYFGGLADTLIQRLIELLQSIPTIPLWMGLAAAIPLSMPPLQVYFIITLIISLIGWTGLAREVRGKFYALKTEDFVTAARLDGNSEMRVITRHMVPSFASHIIATVTLAIPAMILAETSLSFLGIGLRPPTVSWGVLLQEAQNIRTVASAPWLFLPGGAVVTAVLALNFLGDGLRDAADPYA